MSLLTPSTPPTAPAPASNAARWRVQLLGGFRLRDVAGRDVTVSGRSAMLLLARLATAPARSHPREELIEMLWPGVDLEAGRNRLRQTVWVLRSALEAPGLDAMPVLIADRQALRLAAGSVDCDVARFERLLREGRLADAGATYGGDLLPGFYDEWVNDERLRLAALFDRCQAAPAAAAATAPMPTLAALDTAAGEAAPSAPGWRPASLPAYVSRCFGIDRQATRLGEAVHAHRLVTLLGAGGAGKTRLAVELAHALATGQITLPMPDMEPRSFDMVQFVPLLACRNAREVADAIALGLQLRSGETLDAQGPIVRALGGRRALLVLDNVEQLAADAAQDLGALLQRLPQLHLLLTSRRVLGLDGEREFRIRPLELPPVDAPLAEAALNPAVALFVDRARAARDGFRLNERHAAAVCGIVRALEGSPLAIELAAARVRSLTLPAMLQRLQAPVGGDAAGGTPVLDLLSRGGTSNAGRKRHDSLRTVIEMSWQQLDPSQAGLLADLSIFPHGCRLEAAAAVSGLGLDEARARLDALQAQSMLSLDEDEQGELRVTLNAAMCEYAASRLDPDRAPVLRAALRRWLRAWGEALPPTPSLRAMRDEMPNLQTALASAAAEGAGEEAVRLVLALRVALSAVSVPRQVVQALEAALAVCEDRALRCRGLVMLVVLRYELGEWDAARQLAERALAEVPPGDGGLRARALHRHAYIAWLSTRDDIALGQALDEALALAREHGQDDTEAGVLVLQATMAGVVARDHARQAALHRQVLALYQRMGNAHLVNHALYNLAFCAFNQRAYAEVLERADAISDASRRLGNTEFVARAQHLRGNALAGLRRWSEAARAHREAIRLAYGAACLEPLAQALIDLPRALAHLHRPGAALQLSGFAREHWRRHLGEPGPRERHKLRLAQRLAAAQLGAASRDLHAAEGTGLGLADAVALALSDPPA